MKLKQIAIATSFYIVCHLATGATYNLPDEQQLNLSNPFSQTSTPNREVDSGFVDFDLSTPQIKGNQLKKDYLETVKLLKNNQLQDAENKINNLIQQNPKEANFYNLQAVLESLRKENKLSINSFKKAIKIDPKNFRSHLGVASVFLQSGDFSQAKKYTNSALYIDDKSAHAYILLAKIAYQENKLQEVESILLTAQKKTRGNSKQEIIIAGNLAKLYAIQKQPQKALNVAQNIIKLYPADSTALALLANAQIFNNRTAQAIPTLEKLISQEPKDIRHRLLLAKILVKQPENKQQVLKLLGEVSTLAPDNPQVQAQKTIILTQIKLYPEALQTAKKVKQLVPDSGLAEALEGEIYLAEKKQDLALTAFQKSYELKPNTKVLNVITNIMMAQGKQADAIDFLSQELKKNPKNLAAHFTLGNIYQQQNNNREAEKHYQAILAEQPDNVVILNNLAWIYHLDNNPKALELAKRAYEKAPKSAAIADTYAVILVKQGNLEKGLKIFEKASKLAPQNYDIQYHLADAYALKGQNKQAIQILKTITESEQKFSEKEAAISLLKKLN